MISLLWSDMYMFIVAYLSWHGQFDPFYIFFVLSNLRTKIILKWLSPLLVFISWTMFIVDYKSNIIMCIFAKPFYWAWLEKSRVCGHLILKFVSWQRHMLSQCIICHLPTIAVSNYYFVVYIQDLQLHCTCGKTGKKYWDTGLK
jgi:hypothetical protein